MGRNADARSFGTKLLDLREVGGRRLLAKPLDAPATVGGQQEHELDLRSTGGLDGRLRLREPDVVKLADGRIPGIPHLAEGGLVVEPDPSRGQAAGQLQHGIAPAPEVPALRSPSQRPLERVAVGVHEAGKRKPLRHRARLPFAANGSFCTDPERDFVAGPLMAARAISAPLAQIPNALTVLRLALIPLFVVLVLGTDGEGSYVAAGLFAFAGATDQVDGWLARRWNVESTFGQLADPLADRLMIDAAVILLWLDGRLPWPALVVILVRDAALVGGYGLIMTRGYELSVSWLGKAGTWLLYAGLTGMLASDERTTWALALFWSGLAVAMVAAVLYAVTAPRSFGG
jgi:CDP-diacylglycerol--glycerol-3-phosphate 3-phosphatidyltransferase